MEVSVELVGSPSSFEDRSWCSMSGESDNEHALNEHTKRDSTFIVVCFVIGMLDRYFSVVPFKREYNRVHIDAKMQNPSCSTFLVEAGVPLRVVLIDRRFLAGKQACLQTSMLQSNALQAQVSAPCCG